MSTDVSKPTTTVSEQTNNSKEKKQILVEGENFIKHVLKKVGKSTNGQLQLDDLDEKVLQTKLNLLTKEVDDIKERCNRYKKENSWYQQEIEVAERDNAEYISYLESKKDEKLVAIQKLSEGNKRDLQLFQEKKEAYQDCIAELEVKLSGKEDEFLQLSDTMVKRSKHYDDINKIRDEIKAAELKHQELMQKTEKQLLEARLKLQKESDDKIREMESAAEEKAAKYLNCHSERISKENRNLELLLYKQTQKTHQLITRRDALQREIITLENQKRLRDDMVIRRFNQVVDAEKREKERRKRGREKLAGKRRKAVEAVLRKRADNEVAVGDGVNIEFSDDEDDD